MSLGTAGRGSIGPLLVDHHPEGLGDLAVATLAALIHDRHLLLWLFFFERLGPFAPGRDVSLGLRIDHSILTEIRSGWQERNPVIVSSMMRKRALSTSIGRRRSFPYESNSIGSASADRAHGPGAGA